MSDKSSLMTTTSAEALLSAEINEVANKAIAAHVLYAFENATPHQNSETIALFAPFGEGLDTQRANEVAQLIVKTSRAMLHEDSEVKFGIAQDETGFSTGITAYFEEPEAEEKLALFKRLIPHFIAMITQEEPELDLSEGTVIEDLDRPADEELETNANLALGLAQRIGALWQASEVFIEKDYMPYLKATIDTANADINAATMKELFNASFSRLKGEAFRTYCDIDDSSADQLVFYAYFDADKSKLEKTVQGFKDNFDAVLQEARALILHEIRLARLPDKVIDSKTAQEDRLNDHALSDCMELLHQIRHNSEFSPHAYVEEDGTIGTALEIDVSETELSGYSNEEWNRLIAFFNDVSMLATGQAESPLHISAAFHQSNDELDEQEHFDEVIHLVFPYAGDTDTLKDALLEHSNACEEAISSLRLGPQSESVQIH